MKLILLALAALLLAVLGSRSRPQRRSLGLPAVRPPADSRPFPLATGNGRHPHTGIRDPYLDSLTEGRR
jgi:hypothetical protein